jgi:PAS domain S-box-containing protein
MSLLSRIRVWHIILLAFLLSELFTSIMSYILNGRIRHDYLITGGVVPLLVAPVVIYLVTQNRRLVSERDGLQSELIESRRIEEALKAGERKYRDLFENASDAIFVLDTQFNYIDVNKAAVRMLGYSRDELLGMNVFDFVPPDQVPESKKSFELLKSKGEYHNFVGRIRTRDGRWIDVEVSSNAIYLDGEVVGSRDMVRDITERKMIEAALKQSLSEKETLIKEIHHRVKNNLVMIQGLLQLQSDSVSDKASKAAFLESQERIASMGMIHEYLYRSDDLKHMNVSDYIRRLSKKLLENYSSGRGDIRLDLDLEEIFLDVEVMIPCGLILNELITNSLKHAFPRTLNVGLRRESGGDIALTVRDDGPGMPEGFDIEKAESMGMKIVTILTDQLGGTVHVSGNSGTRTRVVFNI